LYLPSCPTLFPYTTLFRSDRIFIEFGPLTVYWYGVIIITGLLIGLYLATRESNRLGLQKDLIVDLIVFAAPIAIIFARMYYVILDRKSTRLNSSHVSISYA